MDWYLRNYTLIGPDQPILEHWLGKTALGTNIYLPLKQMAYEYQNDPLRIESYHTKLELERISRICKAHSVPLTLVAIPSKRDLEEAWDYDETYNFAFEGLEMNFPEMDAFTLDDYSKSEATPHFNNQGHRKFAKFIYSVLERKDSIDILNISNR